MVPICSDLVARQITWRFRALRVGLWILLGLTGTVGRSAEFDAQAERCFAAQATLKSWSADFTQTRSLKVLAQPLLSTGKVWVKPGEFRWELGKPVQTIVLRRPDQLLIVYPILKRAERYPLEGVPSGPIRDALSLMDASIPRDRATMEARFNLLSEKVVGSILQLTLQPKGDARKFIAEIMVCFRVDDFVISATQMKFADGSILRNDFSNVVRNQPIVPGLFDVKLSPDVSVVEPLKP